MIGSAQEILESIREVEPSVRQLREILLGNLVMLGEIPAPTFEEEERIQFLMDRFRQAGLDRRSVDEKGNGVGIIEGSEGNENILLVAHADTVFDKRRDHTIQVTPDRVTGPGVADNSLGVACLATLPHILDNLALRLRNNLVLMGPTRSLGRGNLEGLRFFLSNFDRPIKAGIGIEGVELGRLSHTSIGMKRGVITCKVPEKYDWSRFGESSAILTLNEVINRINEIRTPMRPRTSIIMGSIRGGSSFDTTALKASLQFEIRSESLEWVNEISRQFGDIVTEVASRTGDTVDLDIFAERKPGGIPNSHPLVRRMKQIMESLDIEPYPGPSISELSAFIDRQIPAVTLGLTRGDNLHESGESIRIEPIYKGIAQIIGAIMAIDGGYCDES